MGHPEVPGGEPILAGARSVFQRGTIAALAFFISLASGSLALAEDEPFGMSKSVAPENSTTWQEWKRVINDASAELQKLERCRTDHNCNTAEEKFFAIVKEARDKESLPKIDFVHTRVNHEIHYAPDQAHWGTADRWSLPIDVNGTGSFNTGVGDCEDYVLAKYSILLDSKFPNKDLRILLVRDTFVRMDHAVLAARYDHKWLVLDNRWDRLYEDKDMKQFKPLVVVDSEGVHYLSKMFRIADTYDP